MALKSFSRETPFLHIIVLLLTSFVTVTVFMLIGAGISQALWGMGLMSLAGAGMDFSDPHVINVNRFLLMCQHLGLFVVPSIIFGFLVSTRWAHYIGFRSIDPKVLIWPVLIMVAALPVINMTAWLNEQMSLPESLRGLELVLEQMEESAAELTAAITATDSIWLLVINIIIIAVLPAFGEEMLFRGLLQPMFGRWTGNVHAGIWISALFFSAMHLQFYGFIPRLLMGALFGYFYVWSGSLWAPIIAHFTNNLIAVIGLYLLSNGAVSADLDSFDPNSPDIWYVVVGAILLAVLITVFRRKKLLESEGARL